MTYGSTPTKGTEKYTQLDSLLHSGKFDKEERFDGELSNETVYLCYSSGTTGLSKGVEVSLFTPRGVPAVYFLSH
jgi:long-subunit acyl-CoA synthetase (AMP-forming)